MKIAVVGAGSIGGFVGGRLAAAGEDVTFIARGANLAAIRAHGMRVIGEDGKETVATNARAAESAADAGVQDVVVLAVKAHQVGGVVGTVQRLCGADTPIITMQNGVPWWYFQRHGGPYERTPIRATDPDGTIARAIDPARVIGTVVYPAAVLEAPGIVRVLEGRRITLGELDGTTTPRIERIAAAFTRAGFKAPITDDIRGEIWLKMWGNLSFNPISALTHATLVDLLKFQPTRELSAEMMREAEAIAAKLGVTIRIGIEKRLAGGEKVGAHKTSMLQDVEAGRPMEIEALVGAVVELGRLTSTPTPHIDAVYACARLLGQTLADTSGSLIVAPPKAH